MQSGKSVPITKRMVWEAYKEVRNKGKAAGVDAQSMDAFAENLTDNLYRLWNRMASGSYFPAPVRRAEIPKEGGGTRPLGIPTVTERIAQMVVKRYLEPELERHFHPDSYGYRPGKSAHQAVEQARKRCWRYDWVVDLDIKGFFDTIDHELLMRALRHHTRERWILLLANLFLHYTRDVWLQRRWPQVKFERYADDAVCHCRTWEAAEHLKAALQERLAECGLTLHPEKTKIVYCKDSNRRAHYPIVQFTFLGFAFRPRMARNRWGKLFTNFLPAASPQALKRMRERIRSWRLAQHAPLPLEDIARSLNPVLRAWWQYYGRFYPTEMRKLFEYFDERLGKYLRCKYKKLAGHRGRSLRQLNRIAQQHPTWFVHWQYLGRATVGS